MRYIHTPSPKKLFVFFNPSLPSYVHCTMYTSVPHYMSHVCFQRARRGGHENVHRGQAGDGQDGGGEDQTP